MNISCRLGMLAVFLMAPSIASADDSGWYLGYGLGWSQASQPAPLLTQTDEYRSVYGVRYSSISGDQISAANRLEIGYWFNASFGLQASYADLGHYTGGSVGTAQPLPGSCVSRCPIDFTEAAQVKAHGASLSVTGRVPLSEQFDLIGRLGWSLDTVRYAESSTDLYFSSETYPVDKTNGALVYGVSLGWNFDAHWQALLGWDQYDGIGNSALGKFDVTVLSLGIQYHF